MPDQDGEEDPDITIMDRHVAALMEHFDTVHVFTSRHEPGREGKSMVCDRGSGHWYARYGQVKEWIIRQEREIKRSCDHRDDD